MRDAYEITTYLSRIVLVRPNFYSAGLQASHQLNSALEITVLYMTACSNLDCKQLLAPVNLFLLRERVCVLLETV